MLTGLRRSWNNILTRISGIIHSWYQRRLLSVKSYLNTAAPLPTPPLHALMLQNMDSQLSQMERDLNTTETRMVMLKDGSMTSLGLHLHTKSLQLGLWDDTYLEGLNKPKRTHYVDSKKYLEVE